jgi:hypothetical protein
VDIEQLMTEQGMRSFTDEQRDTFVNDAVQVRQMAQIIQARLANTRIEGDRTGSAGRRARKVSRRFGRVARLLEKAAAEAEAINAVYGREVLELPARRAAEVERKENRRQRLGIAATVEAAAQKSLAESAHAFNGTQAGNPQVTPVQAAPQYVAPYPHQFAPAGGQPEPLENIADLFQDFPEAK